MVKKTGMLAALFFLGRLAVFGQTSFSQGEELFMQNKPAEAMAYLEQTVAEDPANVKASLYLGITYQQLDRVDEAIAVYRKILPRGGSETARIAFNLGNAYFTKGSAIFAEQYYTQAVEADPTYASAYLNRANTRVKNGSPQEARPDYELYLTLEPRSSQRPQIESLLALIREEAMAAEQAEREAAAAAERQKLAAEQAEREAAAAAERQKIAAEQAAREAAERRQRMMEEVAASLQASADSTQGLSAGSENVLGYDGEFELE
jgi:tetratricopeptide (TPR) repeat protein